MLDLARHGQLELYVDDVGRMYAVDVRDVSEGDEPRSERVVGENHAYVLLNAARGENANQFGDTEEDWANRGRTMPEEGTAVELVHVTAHAAAAKKVRITYKWVDAPAALTIRVARAYRYKMQLSGKIEYVLVEAK